MKGTITCNDTLLLGPDPLGHFQPLSVKSIHRKRLPVTEVRGGQSASFALKKVRFRREAWSRRGLEEKSVITQCLEVPTNSLIFWFIQQVKRTAIRKGMVLVSPNVTPKDCWEFEGELLVLHHPTTISANYQVFQD